MALAFLAPAPLGPVAALPGGTGASQRGPAVGAVGAAGAVAILGAMAAKRVARRAEAVAKLPKHMQPVDTKARGP